MNTKIIALFLCISGVVSLVAAVYFYQRTHDLMKNGVRVRAEVFEVVHTTNADALDRYVPKYRFTTADGRVIEKRSGHYSNPPAYRVGDTIPLIYDPENPDGAVEESSVGLWSLSFGFGSAGVLFLFSGLTTLFIGRKAPAAELVRKQ